MQGAWSDHVGSTLFCMAEQHISFLPESERSQYITLKEAAAIAGYSADYIGQLIRAGKLEGRQVYTNVSWVTTEKAVRAYLEGRGKEIDGAVFDPSKYIRYALYVIIGALALALLSLSYILFTSIDRAVSQASLDAFETTIDTYEFE